jgi:formate C-acetyltransferase
LAFGISGLSVVADSLSAIKYAKVTPLFNENGLVVDFKIDGEFPKYGNDNDKVDEIAKWVVHEFSSRLQKQNTYRNSIPTLSLLTITSNVVYGNKTGSTPDGRKKGDPYSPGANPFNCRDTTGAITSLNSVAKLPYDDCLDGISNTFTIAAGDVPTSATRAFTVNLRTGSAAGPIVATSSTAYVIDGALAYISATGGTSPAQ